MFATRLLALSLRTEARRGLVGALALVAAWAMAPATAQAVPLTITVAMPSSVTVDQTGLQARITLTNTSLDKASPRVCNAGECADAEGLSFIPSCGAPSPAFACATPDPGVFAFAPTASPVAGSCGESPLMTSLDVVVADAATGKLRLVPKAGAAITQLVLGPAGSATAACEIVLTFSVLEMPDTDAGREDGVQTLQSVSATTVVTIPGSGIAVGTDTGTTQTTVVPRQVVTPPPPIQPPPIVPPPVIPPPVPPPPPVQPSDLDHFKCYEALQPNLRQRTVGTRDQFGQRRARVLRTRQLCNPVSKNGAKILQPRAHLVCYETRDTGNPTRPRTVLVTNQFGQRKLRTGRPNRLCVPSLKRRGTAAPPTTPNPTRLLDHFRCYDVQQQPAPRTVKLVDQFGTTTTKVVRVIRLCNPVRKNNEPVRRAKSHLVCYSITDSPVFRPLAVRVRNQFGRAALRIRRPETLCLPSFKQVVQTQVPSPAPAGLDHFKCYEAEQPQLPVRFVGLRDQFGQSEGQVVATRQICNPVRKNNGRVLNSHAHLVCYDTPSVGTVPFQPRDVRVSNQFGIRQLRAIRPVTLCVPSLKRKGAGAAPTGANPTLVLDHFRCYDVTPQAAARVVTLRDQFKVSKAKVVRVVRLCNPVRKNNEGIRRPQAHLVCYTITEGTFSPLAVTVRNQFGVAGLRVRRPQMLCLPSLKKLVTAAGAEITTANPA